MKKRKSLLLATVFSFALTPLAMADSAEDLFYQGVNAKKKGNYAQAAELFEQACHGGVAQGCFNLGVLYDNGQGVKQNYAQAAKLWEQACNDDHAWSCYNLGMLYHNGQGKRQNKSTAKKYFAKACDLGDQYGCVDYKKLNIQGY